MQEIKYISTSPKTDFQNIKPEYTLIQLSRNNVIKNASLWISLFFCYFIFSFFVGYILEGKLDYEIVNLDFVISIWGFFAFLLCYWLISFTRRYKYLLPTVNYLFNLILILSFTFIYMLYKFEVFGQISNSMSHPKESVRAIKTLFYAWLVLILFIMTWWYLFILRCKRKYWYSFFKASILIIPLTLYLFTPFFILNFNSTFDLRDEIIFLIISLTLIITFSVSIGFLSRYQTLGFKNLKIVNKVLGYEMSYCSLGSVFGALTYQIYLDSKNLLFEQSFFISLAISLFLLIAFIFIILKTQKIKQNSFFNKIILKVFIICNLLLAIILVYIYSVHDDKIIYSKSLEVIISPFLSILCFYILISVFLKLIIFERWTIFTNLLNFLIAFFFIFLQGIIATLEDGKILYKWLGSYLVIIIISIYFFIELISFFPELALVLQNLKKYTKSKSNNKRKNMKKEVPNV